MDRSRKLIAVVATASALVGGTVAHAATGSDGGTSTLPAVTPLTPAAETTPVAPSTDGTTTPPATDDTATPSPGRGDRGGHGGRDCPEDGGGSDAAPSEEPAAPEEAPATPETTPAPAPTTPDTTAPTTTPDL